LVGVVRKLYTADKDRRANESVERLGQTKVDFPKKITVISHSIFIARHTRV